jgi:xanthine phosphoribosyltransferase
MDKIKKYSHDDIKGAVNELIRQITQDGWSPDYVVGITRGGLLPALMISNYFDVPMHTLKVCLRDHVDTESNCWMAEEAFGYVPHAERAVVKSRWDLKRRKNILIVDDINDSGATFEWIKDDWAAGCLPNEIDAWNSVWGKSTRFAALIDNDASSFQVNYFGTSINKAEDPQWIEFPWESWWK